MGQVLVQKRIISQDHLEEAFREQEVIQEPLEAILVRLNLIKSEKICLSALAEHLGVKYTELKDKEISKSAIAQIPAKFAYHYKAMPVAYENNILTVALSNPLDVHITDELSLVSHTRIVSVLAGEKDILEAIKKYYGVGAETIEQMMDAVEMPKTIESVATNMEEISSEASIAKFINQILLEAYKDRATDIHIEPYEEELKIRYRIDGLLYDTKAPSNIKHFKDSINSRIKIMSNLNIAEKRLPQDGRFNLKIGGIDLDLRVSFLPTPYGESVVIRLLSSTKLYDIKELGLSQENVSALDRLLQKPHGIIFVTGPTGSGKTTTLYSCLARVNREDKKIITIEDPIEYQLKGVTQIQVHPQIGLNFAAGLRSMLRHDPDIMMVGEVRDLETAEITIQVALTGHLVFSTLHTNDAASAVARLIDMGVEPYLVSSAVQCFVAQRLVRLLCPQCKRPVELTGDIVKEFDLKGKDFSGITMYEAQGCEGCKFTGYRGREGIYEFLVLHDDVRDLILSRATAMQIKNKAVQKGMSTLRQDGWQKVLRGITSPSEVIRVTQEEAE